MGRHDMSPSMRGILAMLEELRGGVVSPPGVQPLSLEQVVFHTEVRSGHPTAPQFAQAWPRPQSGWGLGTQDSSLRLRMPGARLCQCPPPAPLPCPQADSDPAVGHNPEAENPLALSLQGCPGLASPPPQQAPLKGTPHEGPSPAPPLLPQG